MTVKDFSTGEQKKVPRAEVGGHLRDPQAKASRASGNIGLAIVHSNSRC